jgi:hypothetical protein
MTLAKAKFILLLTSGCPTTNPRLVKEANALIARGYRIHVIYGYIADWADKLDSGLIEKVNWTCELVGGHPSKRKITWAFSCLVYRSARILQHVGPLKYFASRLSWPLFIAGRRYQPDAIIARALKEHPFILRCGRFSQSREPRAEPKPLSGAN